MIGKNTLKKFEYKTIEEYFNYIVESQINGNHSQVRELFKRLDKTQKEDFFNYLKSNELKFDYTGVF